MPNRSTNLVIISGPSGSGHDSIIEGLIKRGLPIERVIVHIARPMRPTESEGKPYYFVSKKKFDLMIQNNELIEWAEVYDSKRGATKKELERVLALINKIIIWKMDWKGTITAKKLFPDILTIMIAPPSLEALAERSRKRGQQTEAEIQDRFNYSQEFLRHADLYDYVVVNEEGKLERTISKVMSILKKENYIVDSKTKIV